MKCERCGRNEATFYYQSNINGRVTQVHLCPDCAAELGYTSRLEQSFRPFRRSFFDPFSLLEDFGIIRALREFGVKDGQEVRLNGETFDFVD